MVTVREVESGGVKTGIDQFLQLFDFPAGRSEGAEDLGGPLVNTGLVEDHFNINVSTGEFRSIRLHLGCFRSLKKAERVIVQIELNSIWSLSKNLCWNHQRKRFIRRVFVSCIPLI